MMYEFWMEIPLEERMRAYEDFVTRPLVPESMSSISRRRGKLQPSDRVCPISCLLRREKLFTIFDAVRELLNPYPAIRFMDDLDSGIIKSLADAMGISSQEFEVFE